MTQYVSSFHPPIYIEALLCPADVVMMVIDVLPILSRNADAATKLLLADSLSHGNKASWWWKSMRAFPHDQHSVWRSCLAAPRINRPEIGRSFAISTHGGGDKMATNLKARIARWHHVETFTALYMMEIHRSLVIFLTNDQWRMLWYFLWCQPKRTIKQTIELSVIWDAMVLIVTSSLWNLK